MASPRILHHSLMAKPMMDNRGRSETMASLDFDPQVLAAIRKELEDDSKSLDSLEGVQKKVGILTSGGDAPGMNAAVRAVASIVLSCKSEIYGIKNGYSGLVAGGDCIQKLEWKDVAYIMHKGGTFLGSARCAEFRTREGRLRAAENLIRIGINNLVAIGGDGTLTGADTFRAEWPALLAELKTLGRITEEQEIKYSYLTIIGMVGSIDNDMCGFSMTIGADTALHRIVTAIDQLVTTAESHQRSFIVEVMGRNCGFLALIAALVTGADWVFVPERPVDAEDWESVVCESISRRRQSGVNCTLVILAEGATDRVRRPITAEYLRALLTKRLGHDTRITTLGHVQRGGAPSAYDRLLGTRAGAEAGLAILKATNETPSRIVGIQWTKIIQIDLAHSVAKTRSVEKVLDEKNFEKAMNLRGPTFKEELDLYYQLREPKSALLQGPRYRVAVLNCGSPAAGMNAALRTVARLLMSHGHEVFGVKEGFSGLYNGGQDFVPLEWYGVHGWLSEGGSKLGTNRHTPSDMKDGFAVIANNLLVNKINALVVIGGFDGFVGALELLNERKNFPSLCIPIACVPATMSNNIPGTDLALGTDTALNVIVESIDLLRQSAKSSRNRVFIIETMGSYCGYLANIGALAGGADSVYTFEEGVTIDDLKADIDHVRKKFKDLPSSPAAMLVRGELANPSYTTDFLQSLFEEAGKHPTDVGPSFTTRNNILGHRQQGGSPSPLDRLRAIQLASTAVNGILTLLKGNTQDNVVQPLFSKESAFLVGVDSRKIVTTPIEDLIPYADFKHNLPTGRWARRPSPLIRILANNARGQEIPKYRVDSEIDDPEK